MAEREWKVGDKLYLLQTGLNAFSTREAYCAGIVRKVTPTGLLLVETSEGMIRIGKHGTGYATVGSYRYALDTMPFDERAERARTLNTTRKAISKISEVHDFCRLLHVNQSRAELLCEVDHLQSLLDAARNAVEAIPDAD